MTQWFFKPLLDDAAARHRLLRVRQHHVIADELLSAFDSASRKTGLLKHESMPENSAMIIAPCSAIHTFFMKFAIDVAFVAKDGRVVKTVPALKPWRIACAFRASAVIELPSGTLARTNTQTGDTLIVN